MTLENCPDVWILKMEICLWNIVKTFPSYRLIGFVLLQTHINMRRALFMIYAQRITRIGLGILGIIPLLYRKNGKNI